MKGNAAYATNPSQRPVPSAPYGQRETEVTDDGHHTGAL